MPKADVGAGAVRAAGVGLDEVRTAARQGVVSVLSVTHLRHFAKQCCESGCCPRSASDGALALSPDSLQGGVSGLA